MHGDNARDIEVERCQLDRYRHTDGDLLAQMSGGARKMGERFFAVGESGLKDVRVRGDDGRSGGDGIFHGRSAVMVGDKGRHWKLEIRL